MMPSGTKFDIQRNRDRWVCRALLDTEEHGFVWHDLGSHQTITKAVQTITKIVKDDIVASLKASAAGQERTS